MLVFFILLTIVRRYWESFNEHQVDQVQTLETIDSTRETLAKATAQLHTLNWYALLLLKQSTLFSCNLFNELFPIYVEGHFVTINNCRLGRLPSLQVDWDENNAAWGYASLLTVALANSLKHQFKTFVMFCSTSYF